MRYLSLYQSAVARSMWGWHRLWTIFCLICQSFSSQFLEVLWHNNSFLLAKCLHEESAVCRRPQLLIWRHCAVARRPRSIQYSGRPYWSGLWRMVKSWTPLYGSSSRRQLMIVNKWPHYCSQFGERLQLMLNYRLAFVERLSNVCTSNFKNPADTDMHKYAMALLRRRNVASLVSTRRLWRCWLSRRWMPLLPQR